MNAPLKPLFSAWTGIRMEHLGSATTVQIDRRKRGILLNHNALTHIDGGGSDDVKTRPEKYFKKNALNHRFVVACSDQDWYSG